KAGVEIILLHFRISLVVVPLVMGEPVDGAHYTRPVPAAGAMHEKLSCSCVINQLQERSNLPRLRIILAVHGNVDIPDAQSFDVPLFIWGWIVAQIDNGFDAQTVEVLVVLLLRLSATEKAFIHLAKVFDLCDGGGSV